MNLGGDLQQQPRGSVRVPRCTDQQRFLRRDSGPVSPKESDAFLAVVRELLDNDLPAQVRARGQYLQTQLRRRFGQHPHVGDIRGRGLFWGIEFVADRETKTPFDPALGLAGKLKKAAFANGLICYPMPGTRDGKHGDHVLLAPPFIATEAELDGALACLETAIREVFPG